MRRSSTLRARFPAEIRIASLASGDVHRLHGLKSNPTSAVALATIVGTDQVTFTIVSGPPFANIKRTGTHLSQAARKSADSRVYAGIHFRSACEDGIALGRKIGHRVATSYLLPLRN